MSDRGVKDYPKLMAATAGLGNALTVLIVLTSSLNLWSWIAGVCSGSAAVLAYILWLVDRRARQWGFTRRGDIPGDVP